MARKARNTLDSNLVLITQASACEVFRDDLDRQHFLSLIEKAQKQYNCDVLAFCCAEDKGFQLVIDTQGSNLSRILQSISISYAMYRKCENRLFEQRYKSYPIHSIEQLKEVVQEVGLKDPQFAGCCFMKGESHPWMKSVNLDFKSFERSQHEITSKTYLEKWLAEKGITFQDLMNDRTLRNQAIFELRQHSNCTLKRLSKAFNLSESTISKILKQF